MSSRRIGNYQVIEYVGSGGFGSVFKAEDVHTPGRVVAIKELHKKHTRNQVIKQRFFQEAVAMARLDHPNLPRLWRSPSNLNARVRLSTTARLTRRAGGTTAASMRGTGSGSPFSGREARCLALSSRWLQ